MRSYKHRRLGASWEPRKSLVRPQQSSVPSRSVTLEG
jgi:hypothetical protein